MRKSCGHVRLRPRRAARCRGNFGAAGAHHRPDGRPHRLRPGRGRPRRRAVGTGDALHGPRSPGARPYVLAFSRPNSRAGVAHVGYFEDSVRLARRAAPGDGPPRPRPGGHLCAENGLRPGTTGAEDGPAGSGGITDHPQYPGRPQGRGQGKNSNCFFGICGRSSRRDWRGHGRGTGELNKLFTACTRRFYHARPHGRPGSRDQRLAGRRLPFPTPSPEQLPQELLWGAEYGGPQGRNEQDVRRRYET